MKKFCPLSAASDQLIDCGDRCMMYDWENGGCLIKQAIKTYIDSHKPIQVKMPTSTHIPAYNPDDMTGLQLCP